KLLDSQAITSLATYQADTPFILANAVYGDFHIPVTSEPRKFIAPLYQENTVFGDQVVEAQSLQFSKRIYAIEVDVIKVGLRSSIFVNQGERGAGDVVF